MHRVGTIKGRIDDPKTLAERLISRRLELKLSQGQVADQVQFYNEKKQEWGTLSRSAYCMYESGDVVPDLAKIEQISKALKCEPEWLTFGKGNRSEVEEVDYDAETKEFASKAFWTLNEAWVRQTFGVEPGEITLCQIDSYSPGLRPGDIAIVLKGGEPTASGAEFVFVEEGNILAAQVTKPARGTTLRIFESDGRTYREASVESVQFLGRVIGRMGALG
jgi:transcriptional regulator with XRE-family HTH domain